MVAVITDLKTHVHILTNRLQAILGYLELEDYKAALTTTRAAVKDVRALAAALAGQVMAMPPKQHSVVIVPPGTQVEEAQNVNLTEPNSDTPRILANNVVAIVNEEDVEKK